MILQNERFHTKGVGSSISPLLQLFMWQCIEEMPPPKDYLQIFRCTIEDGKQKIVHEQENPVYKTAYLLNADTPIFIGKIYVIDDGGHSIMMLAEEY